MLDYIKDMGIFKAKRPYPRHSERGNTRHAYAHQVIEIASMILVGKEILGNLLDLNLVAGAGFEPTTFRL